MVPVAPEEAQLGGGLLPAEVRILPPPPFFSTVSPAAPLGRRLEPTLGKVVGTQFSCYETLTSYLPFPTAFFMASTDERRAPTGYGGAAPAGGLADNVGNHLPKGFSAGAFIYRTRLPSYP
jgi:hypothetical protein